MKTMNVTDFKAHCLRVLEEAFQTGEPVEVVKRGQTIGTFEPKRRREASYEPGQFKDEIKIVGDIMEPITPLEDWDLEKQWF